MSDAVMVGVFTLSGVVLSSGLTWFTSFLQHRRAAHEFEQREKRQDRVRLAEKRLEDVGRVNLLVLTRGRAVPRGKYGLLRLLSEVVDVHETLALWRFQ